MPLVVDSFNREHPQCHRKLYWMAARASPPAGSGLEAEGGIHAYMKTNMHFSKYLFLHPTTTDLYDWWGVGAHFTAKESGSVELRESIRGS